MSGRHINDDMGKYVAESLIKQMIVEDVPVKKARIGILGFTFKEDCPDTRNTKVIDIVRELEEYGVSPRIYDPIADIKEVKEEYGIELCKAEDMRDMDAIILAVSHKTFVGLDCRKLDDLYNSKSVHKKILFDIKGVMDKKDFEKAGYVYWRL